MSKLHAIFLLFAVLAVVAARRPASPAQKRTLILIDNASFHLTHSQFFKLIADLDHSVKVEQISVKQVTEGLVKLEEDKEHLYDNVIFMASSLAELPEVKGFNLPSFFEKGGNIFFLIDNDVSPFFREYFKKFGFGVERAGTYVVDYETALDSAKPTVFQLHNFRDIHMLVEKVKGPLVYSGLALESTIFENNQISVFARGNMNTASIAYETSGRRAFSTMGKNNQLILGIQVLSV